jgi:hypothetical protein
MLLASSDLAVPFPVLLIPVAGLLDASGYLTFCKHSSSPNDLLLLALLVLLRCLLLASTVSDVAPLLFSLSTLLLLLLIKASLKKLQT